MKLPMPLLSTLPILTSQMTDDNAFVTKPAVFTPSMRIGVNMNDMNDENSNEKCMKRIKNENVLSFGIS